MTSSSYLSYALNSPAGSVAGAVIPLETGSGCVSCFCHSCCRQLTEPQGRLALFWPMIPVCHWKARWQSSCQENLTSIAARNGGKEGLLGLEKGATFWAPPSLTCFSSQKTPHSSELRYSCNHSSSQPKNSGSAFRNVSYGISHVSRNKEHLSTTLKWRDILWDQA